MLQLEGKSQIYINALILKHYPFYRHRTHMMDSTPYFSPYTQIPKLLSTMCKTWSFITDFESLISFVLLASSEDWIRNQGTSFARCQRPDSPDLLAL